MTKRLRITHEIDVEDKDYHRLKFNLKLVAFFADADQKLKGKTVLLTVEEVEQ